MSIEVSFLRVGVRLVFGGDVFVGVLCPVVLCGVSLRLGLSSVCVVLSRFGRCALRAAVSFVWLFVEYAVVACIG